jgi:hypothetical protein
MRIRAIHKILFLLLVLASIVGAVHVTIDPGVPLSYKVAMVAAAAFFFSLVVVFAAAKRSPGNEIANLLQQKKVEDACALSRALLLRRPKDLVVRLNAVAAFFTAGQKDEARRTLEGLPPERLNDALRRVYNDWKSKLVLAPPKSPEDLS